MRAIRIHRHGGPEVLTLEDVPDPVPAEGEALIEVGAAGLNHVELDVRAGISGMPVTLPLIPGLELAGTVAEVRGLPPPGIRVGTPVAVAYTIACRDCGYCRTGRDNLCRRRQTFGVSRPGSYAELTVAPFAALIPLPDGVDVRQAAAAQIAFSTAWHVLVTRGQLAVGQTVLIHAVGSGIGSAGIQIARLAGARVIATSSSAAKLERARTWADEVVDYSRPDWVDEVLDLTGGAGVDVVMSHVGGDEFRGSLRAVRDDGAVVVVGGHAGEVVEVDLISLFRRQLRIIGSSRATRVEIAQVLDLVGRGAFAPQVHCSLPLAEAARGHTLLAERQAYGKVLLEPALRPAESLA